MAFARGAAHRPSVLVAARFLDPGAVAAVALALVAIATPLTHLPPLWAAAAALAAAVLGLNARRRNLKPRRPTVDHVRSLVLSVLAILLAMAGFAVVAPSLLVQLQARLTH
ncbi:MAG TPA: hypothetical protein VIO84_08260 [Candidatus Dormibacteraeota bacterium]|jgi:hypothetical protein